MISPGEYNSSTAQQTQKDKSPSPKDRTCSKMQMSFPLKDTHGNRVDLEVEIQVSLLSRGLLGSCSTNSSTCRAPRHLPSSLLICRVPTPLSLGAVPMASIPIPVPASESLQAWV